MSGPGTPLGGPTTPHTPSSEASRFGPQTPDRFPVPSPGMVPPTTPQAPNQDGKQHGRYSGPSPQAGNTSNGQSGPKTPGVDNSRFPVPSPKGNISANSGGSTPGSDASRFRSSPLPGDMNSMGARFPNPTQQPGNHMKLSSTFSMSPGNMGNMEIGSDFNNTAAANLPLNPNCTTPGGMPNSSVKHFDPISSMAQMSQQLTSGPSGGSPPASATVGQAPPAGAMMDSPGSMLAIPPVSTSPNMITSPVGGPRGTSPGTMSMMTGPNPRMVGPRAPGPGPNCTMAGPYSGANVQVKPSAPNTIQYLPARPNQSGVPGPRPAPSLDFLPRFNNPSGVEKMNPGMFPNSSTPNSMCGPNASTMAMSGPCPPMNGPMCTMTGPMNGPGNGMGSMACSMPSGGPAASNMTTMSGGPTPPFPGGPMGMCTNGPMGGPGMGSPMGGPNGAMMGPNGPMPGPGGPMMGPNGPMTMNPNMMGPGGQMMGPRGGSAMMRGTSPGMMPGPVMSPEMYSMSGPGPNMSGGPGGQPGPNQMMAGSPSMYGPKGSPVGVNMGGGAPDAAQPLPPSMGQSGNFKNSPFMAPTTADPTYAAQFHNFQQQLYATNTRPGHGPMGPMPTHVGPGGPVGPMVSCSGGGMPPGVPGPGHMGVQGYPSYNSK